MGVLFSMGLYFFPLTLLTLLTALIIKALGYGRRVAELADFRSIWHKWVQLYP